MGTPRYCSKCNEVFDITECPWVGIDQVCPVCGNKWFKRLTDGQKTHRNARRILERATSPGVGTRQWSLGDDILACAVFEGQYTPEWWMCRSRISRQTARIILRGLLAE